MYATIQRWGNSQGLRIPKALLDALGLRENDRVELIQSDDGIQIKKAAAGHRTLRNGWSPFTASLLTRFLVWRHRRSTGAKGQVTRYGDRF